MKKQIKNLDINLQTLNVENKAKDVRSRGYSMKGDEVKLQNYSFVVNDEKLYQDIKENEGNSENEDPIYEIENGTQYEKSNYIIEKYMKDKFPNGHPKYNKITISKKYGAKIDFDYSGNREETRKDMGIFNDNKELQDDYELKDLLDGNLETSGNIKMISEFYRNTETHTREELDKMKNETKMYLLMNNINNSGKLNEEVFDLDEVLFIRADVTGQKDKNDGKEVDIRKLLYTPISNHRANNIKTIVVVDGSSWKKERKYYKTYKVTGEPDDLDSNRPKFNNIEEIKVDGIKDISESIGQTLNSINPMLRID